MVCLKLSILLSERYALRLAICLHGPQHRDRRRRGRRIYLFGKHCLYINFFIGMQLLKMSLMCVMIVWWFDKVLVDFTRLNPELWDMVALQ